MRHVVADDFSWAGDAAVGTRHAEPSVDSDDRSGQPSRSRLPDCRAGGTRELRDRQARGGHRACRTRRSRLDDAVHSIEELEETAKLYLLLNGTRTIRFLTNAQVVDPQRLSPS